MASPNIVSPTSILLKSIGSTVGTGVTTLVTCPANKAAKISSLTAANVTETATAVTIRFNDGTATAAVVWSISVPSAASLICVVRDQNPVYLKEGESLQAIASATGAIQITGSYEEIS